MSLRKDWIRSVLSDAILDREEFLRCLGSGDKEQEAATLRDLSETRALRGRYEGGARPPLSDGDLRTVRRACRHALIWREGFLDANSNQPRSVRAPIEAEIRQAKAVLAAAGGRVPDPFAGMGSISVFDLARGIGVDRCTSVEVTHAGGAETRALSERGASLGKVEVDDTGTVRVTLPDGKILNRPFASADEAQDWLLRKFSRNAIFAGPARVGDDVDDGPDAEAGAASGPGMR